MTINCRGRLVDLDSPKVMGILNITPDSFYSGSRVAGESLLLEQAGKMLKEGASFLDIGGYSSRPGATDISTQEELERVLPAVKAVLRNFPEAVISVDTFRAEVARQCLDAGAALVNDISAGLLDQSMMETVAGYNVPYIMMHMRGTPQTMKSQTDYDDLIPEIRSHLAERVAEAVRFGISDIILDPGFGFAKTIDQNFQLLLNLKEFKTFNLPVLVGLSRKSMVYKTLDINPEEALNGTTALHMIALRQGAHILRVHDVKEAVQCIKLARELQH